MLERNPVSQASTRPDFKAHSSTAATMAATFAQIAMVSLAVRGGVQLFNKATLLRFASSQRQFWRSQRASALPRGDLSHLRSSLRYQRPSNYKQFEEKLFKEFHFNPQLRLVLAVADKLVSKDLNLLIAKPGVKLKKEDIAKGFYSTSLFRPFVRSDIVLAATEEDTKGIHKTSEDAYLALLVHELTHAIDSLVLKQELPLRDALKMKLYSLLERDGKFEYSRPESQALQDAIDSDRERFSRLPEQSEEGCAIFDRIYSIKEDYSEESYLEELKSAYMELCTLGAFGPDKLKEYLPAVSAWFAEHFFPKCEEFLKREATPKERLSSCMSSLFPKWEANLAESKEPQESQSRKVVSSSR